MKPICIEYPKCSTCKKAMNWLKENGIDFIDRDIVKDNPSKEELKEWINKSNIPINKWFNTSGLVYKELKLKDKLKDMSDKEKIDLLSKNGKLIKRPIFVSDKIVLIGFKEEEWQKVL